MSSNKITFLLILLVTINAQNYIKYNKIIDENNQTNLTIRELQNNPNTSQDNEKCIAQNSSGLYCVQCQLNRVLPDCKSIDGHYFDKNCNENYSFVQGECECNGTCDNSELYYSSQLGKDLKSIVITFNQIIGVKKTTLNQINDGFALSYDNCSILAQQTQINYGLYGTRSSHSGCYIRQSQQYQFVIQLGEEMVLNNLAKPPQIDSSQILVFTGIPLYSPLKIGVSAITSQESLDMQIRAIPPICQFQSRSFSVSTSQTTEQNANLKKTILNIMQTFQAVQMQKDWSFQQNSRQKTLSQHFM
ncbi:hypothetical protein TTHERM_00085320 (macronuclear) [Tetrahymena thermophila SB210]|uniref:Transmembrane protein n=1 Tax=Tetrahymena thermophila (strain SB210) TaxID=312017 RepID=Q236R6_TETTS|nr:hypothetical protein TTHERM_00085320 [Tetrahymena thermophila SB210]EAR92434.2 hypothetical protein TTHERM_00085320 [Tetrahymena thermophila SB210]|eukprot:XP_001012679.2 hypothetical protein TTHERM_00085320 [Tetrahymena thermophila SB210]